MSSLHTVNQYRDGADTWTEFECGKCGVDVDFLEAEQKLVLAAAHNGRIFACPSCKVARQILDKTFNDKEKKMGDAAHDDYVESIQKRLKAAGRSTLNVVVKQSEEWSVKDPVFCFECIALAKAMISGNTNAFKIYADEYLGSCERLEIEICEDPLAGGLTPINVRAAYLRTNDNEGG